MDYMIDLLRNTGNWNEENCKKFNDALTMSPVIWTYEDDEVSE